MGKFKLIAATLALSACGPGLTSCTTNPATGESEFTPFMSRSQERAIGAQQHPELLQQFGGPYDDAQLAGYVASIGARMAANSELADEQFTFTLLNSQIINAFALPGGYVYISRQLLGLMNSEAELASVLGHEIGHVTARHSAKRYNTQIFGGLGGVLVGVLTGSGQLGQAASQAAQVYTLSYSRSQELQADDLGIRYLVRANYDPFASVDMLRSLGAMTALDARTQGQEEAEQVPEWARTHPLTEDRVAEAAAEAAATGVAAGTNPRNRETFLKMIDGMLWDDDPEQGFIRGRLFVHPELRLSFRAPEGAALINTERAVIVNGPNGQAQFSGGKLQSGESLQAYVGRVWQALAGQQAGAGLSNVSGTTINGLPAAIGQTQVNTQQGQVQVTIVAYNFGGNQAYHFVALTPPGGANVYDGLFRSLQRISASEAAKYKPRVIDVVTVRSGDTIEKLASRMAYDDYRLERFMVLNNLDPDTRLRAGQQVKLIVYGSPS